MARYHYEIVNVFAESYFGGNPLAVFTNATGLSDDTMQLIARQLNLSETVFLFPSDHAAAALRIYTPAYELPFAGHPVIGSAYVVHQCNATGSSFQLETKAGLIPINLQNRQFVLTANTPKQTPSGLTKAQAAEMLGLTEADIALEPVWVDTGAKQLLIKLSSRQSVLSAIPDVHLFKQRASKQPGQSNAYLWSEEENIATVRLFFENNGQLVEDPGTGSACANLGGWCVLNKHYPIRWRVEQGAVLNRPNVLHLSVSESGVIEVGGEVLPIGHGEMALPD